MAKHSYENYRRVREVLTQKYYFRYGGIGNNFEECFYRDSAFPETIHVHPMFCSFTMDSCNGSRGYMNRKHDVTFPSNRFNQASQNAAFLKLCQYLDEHTSLKKVHIESTLMHLETRRLELVRRALDVSVDITIKKSIPAAYAKLIAEQSRHYRMMSVVP